MSTQTIHLRGDLLSQIKQKAVENERSISSEIAYRLKHSLIQEQQSQQIIKQQSMSSMKQL